MASILVLTADEADTITKTQEEKTATKTPEKTDEKSNILPNDLRHFASFNYIFTLSALTTHEINSPDTTYRQGKTEIPIIKSGGGVKPLVPLRQREYFIDNVQIKSIIAPKGTIRQSNATSINFEITEPYSMGIFLETLQTSAILAGHGDYLQAPYLLEVEFVGWDTNGFFVPSDITNTMRRMFPFKFVNIDFSVDAAGSAYNVTAIPWHEQAFSSSVQTAKVDYTLEGFTVADLALKGGKSISSLFSEREIAKQKANELNEGNQYIVSFPVDPVTATANEDYNAEDTVKPAAVAVNTERELSAQRRQEVYTSISGSTSLPPADFDLDLSQLLGIVIRRSQIGESIRKYNEDDNNINEIGKSVIIDDPEKNKQIPMAPPVFATGGAGPGYVSRANVQRATKKFSISFPKGMTIQEILEEIILQSEYCKRIKDLEPDVNGMIPWFKIETHCFVVDNPDEERSSGNVPKVFVYRVYPHKVHINRFNPPKNTAYGLETLESECVKKYDYIYTGENDSVLDFNINFNLAFFTALSSFRSSRQETNATAQESVAGDVTGSQSTQKNDGQEENVPIASVTIQEENTPSSGSKAGYNDNPAVKIARDVGDALLNSGVDLITADLKILGDPYFIADSGMGNYSAAQTDRLNVSADGTMDYQRSEVDILVKFTTPIDYTRGGDYIARFDVNRQFSGIYQVIQCQNNFEQGMFTQELKLIRRRNQKKYDAVAEEKKKQVVQVEKKVYNVTDAHTGQTAQIQENSQSAIDDIKNKATEYAEEGQSALNKVREVIQEGVAVVQETIATAQDTVTATLASAQDTVTATLASAQDTVTASTSSAQTAATDTLSTTQTAASTQVSQVVNQPDPLLNA